MKFKNSISRLLMLGLLAPQVAFADGIELPKVVRPTMGGDYVVRTVISTTESVKDLKYGLFYVTKDGRIDKPIADTIFRPAVINTQAGQKHNLLIRFPSQSIASEQFVGLCMWKEPPSAVSGTPSQLLASFRYCRLFTAKP